MSRQIAWVFTHWALVNGVYTPALVANLQEGEGLACAASFWMYGTPLARHMLVVKGVAEEARINLLNGSIHFVIATTWEDESNQTPTSRPWSSPLSAAEVTALSTYLVNKTGLTNTQIANWFGLTAIQLSNWLQNNPRSEAVARMLEAWREWRN